MAGGQKKVIVRLYGQAPQAGYLPASGFVEDGSVALLDPAGRSSRLPLADVKHIAFVRDFNLDDGVDPERIGRRTFLARPRGEGLWVRITFRDGEALDGLADNGLPLLDGLVADEGMFLAPPDARANTLRLFVPRASMAGAEILSVVTTAVRKKPAERAAEAQPDLFGGV